MDDNEQNALEGLFKFSYIFFNSQYMLPPRFSFSVRFTATALQQFPSRREPRGASAISHLLRGVQI